MTSKTLLDKESKRFIDIVLRYGYPKESHYMDIFYLGLKDSKCPHFWDTFDTLCEQYLECAEDGDSFDDVTAKMLLWLYLSL